jgi:hypothetical protein
MAGEDVSRIRRLSPPGAKERRQPWETGARAEVWKEPRTMAAKTTKTAAAKTPAKKTTEKKSAKAKPAAKSKKAQEGKK